MTDALPPTPIDADRTLVERCLAGDAAARRRLVELHYASVRQTVELAAVRRGGPILPADVDDAVQQAFFGFLSHDLLVLRRWRGQARLKTYLNRVADRIARRHFRQAAGHRGRFRLIFTAEGAGGPAGDPAAILEAAAQEAQRAGALETAPGLEALLVDAEGQAELRAAILQRLTEKGRDYYRHLFVDELDVAAICTLESTNPNNVYQWKNRILREVAAVLAERADPSNGFR